MKTASLTVTGTGTLGAANLALIIRWLLTGCPGDQAEQVSFAIAAFLILAAHAAQKIVAWKLADRADEPVPNRPNAVPQPQDGATTP